MALEVVLRKYRRAGKDELISSVGIPATIAASYPRGTRFLVCQTMDGSVLLTPVREQQPPVVS